MKKNNHLLKRIALTATTIASLATLSAAEAKDFNTSIQSNGNKSNRIVGVATVQVKSVLECDQKTKPLQRHESLEITVDKDGREYTYHYTVVIINEKGKK